MKKLINLVQITDRHVRISQITTLQAEPFVYKETSYTFVGVPFIEGLCRIMEEVENFCVLKEPNEKSIWIIDLPNIADENIIKWLYREMIVLVALFTNKEPVICLKSSWFTELILSTRITNYIQLKLKQDEKRKKMHEIYPQLTRLNEENSNRELLFMFFSFLQKHLSGRIEITQKERNVFDKYISLKVIRVIKQWMR